MLASTFEALSFLSVNIGLVDERQLRSPARLQHPSNSTAALHANPSHWAPSRMQRTDWLLIPQTSFVADETVRAIRARYKHGGRLAVVCNRSGPDANAAPEAEGAASEDGFHRMLRFAPDGTERSQSEIDFLSGLPGPRQLSPSLVESLLPYLEGLVDDVARWTPVRCVSPHPQPQPQPQPNRSTLPAWGVLCRSTCEAAGGDESGERPRERSGESGERSGASMGASGEGGAAVVFAINLQRQPTSVRLLLRCAAGGEHGSAMQHGGEEEAPAPALQATDLLTGAHVPLVDGVLELDVRAVRVLRVSLPAGASL